MATENILALLIAERDKLNNAIEALSGPKRRGRPPGVKTSASASAEATSPAPRKGRTFTAAQRKAFGERMKAYWAKRRKKKS
ncbi:MAG: hypothetical protein ABSB35_18265 [Bryobacteraceae bacterium]|jgi:hypothetical protein